MVLLVFTKMHLFEGAATILNFWPSKLFQNLPKPSPNTPQTLQNRFKIEPRSLLEPFWKGVWRSNRIFRFRAQKKHEKNGPKHTKTLPKPSQNPPKPFQNWFKNACEKNMVLGSVFFAIVFNFGRQNHKFFSEFLLHAGIQISWIFGTLSLSQFSGFGLTFDTF